MGDRERPVRLVGDARRRDRSRVHDMALFAALLFFLAANALVRAEANADAGEVRPGLILIGADAKVIAHAPQLDTEVSMAVTGLLARVKVIQRYTNPADIWVEGIYVFPLPEDAAVDRLRMRYAGRLIEGEVKEKAQARKDYEQARAQGKGASLLDQQRANIFTTSVANIPPGETVEITIEYQQQAHWQDQTYSLRFPMVVGPRYIPGAPLHTETSAVGAHGWAHDTDEVPDASAITPPVIADADDDFNPVAIAIDLDAGLPLAQISSPYHAIDSEQVDTGRYRITLADGRVPAERDFVIRWRPELAQQPSAALFSQQWQADHYSLLMLMPPQTQGELPSTARELILVVDTSGSMHGASIDQARDALDLALKQLRPDDRFNVIQFSNSLHSLFGQAVPATARNLSQARHYVRGLQAEGGTEMLPAMRQALAGPAAPGLLRQVVFLTDGAVGNEQALFQLIADRLGSSRLFTVGIGSAPNGLFMRKAAELGRGTFSYIGSTIEVEEKMGRLFEQLSAPVLTDVQVAWQTGDGEDVVDQAPRVVPDLYAGQPISIAVRSDQPIVSARIAGRLGDRPWTHRIPLAGGAPAESVHVLWARRMIDDWLARQVTGTDAETIRAEVLKLALGHHLVSRYTSLVAVDKTPSRPDGEGLESAPVPSRLPAGWSARAVFGQLPGTATAAPLLMLSGLLGLLVAFFSRRRA